MPCPRVTHARFALLIEEVDATFDVAEVQRLCQIYHAVHMEEQEEA